MKDTEAVGAFRLRTLTAVSLGMVLGGVLYLHVPSLVPNVNELDDAQRLVTFFLTVSLCVLAFHRRLALSFLGLAVGFALHGLVAYLQAF